jgi:hypothetical protein
MSHSDDACEATPAGATSVSSRDPPCGRCLGVNAQDKLSRGRHEVPDEAASQDQKEELEAMPSKPRSSVELPGTAGPT